MAIFAVVALIFSKKRLISHNSREIIVLFYLYWLIIRKFYVNLHN